MSQKPLHIGLVHAHYPPMDHFGGIIRYIAALGKGYAALGHRVTVISRSDENPRVDTWEGTTVHRIRIPESPLQRLPKGQLIFGGPEVSKAFSQEVHRLHAKDPFDVVEFSNWAGEGVHHSRHKAAPHVLRAVSMLWQMPLTIPGYKVGPAGHWHAYYENQGVYKADLILTPTKAHAESVYQKFGLSKMPEAIPLGVDLPENPPEPTTSTDGGVTFLFLSALSARKGFDVLVKAFAKVHANSKVPVRLSVIGHDPARDEGGTYGQWSLSQIPESARAAITYHGALTDSELPGHYASCDVFVCPSNYESFGLIFLEAMRFKKPVIGCTTGGVPEVAPNGIAGILTQPGDIDALAEAMGKLAHDAALRKKLGDSAYTYWQNGFTERAMCEASVEAYRRLLASRQ